MVPAVMQLLGDRNWYLPQWLAWLPNVHIEGEAAAAPTGGLRAAVERRDPDRVTVALAGDLDLGTGRHFANQLTPIERERPATIVIDQQSRRDATRLPGQDAASPGSDVAGAIRLRT